MYGKEMEIAVASDTSGDFEKILVSLIVVSGLREDRSIVVG